jgi:hypothetical protein
MSPPTTSELSEDHHITSQAGRVNGQLTTPALSPIDEHAHDSLLARGDLVELPERTARQGSDRRRSSEARVWKLSPKQVRATNTITAMSVLLRHIRYKT